MVRKRSPRSLVWSLSWLAGCILAMAGLPAAWSQTVGPAGPLDQQPPPPSPSDTVTGMVSMDVKDRSLRDVVEFIRDKSGGVNIVLDETIDERVTVTLKDVPWREALEIVVEKANCLVIEKGPKLLKVEKPPRITFAVSDAQYLLTFIVMLGIGLVISHLTSRLHAQLQASQQQERRTAELFRMTRQLSELSGSEFLVRTAGRQVEELFDGEVVVFLQEPNGELALRFGEETSVARQPVNTIVAQWVTQNGKLAGAGTDTLPNATALFVPLVGSQRTVGALGVRPHQESRFLDPEQRRLLGAGDEMDDDLGIHGRLEDRSLALQTIAQQLGVHQVAVVRHRQAAASVLDDQRLRVLQVRRSGGRVAVVADRRMPLQTADDVLAKDVGDEAGAPVRHQDLAVGGDNARRLLPPVLERAQAEVREVGSLGVAVNADHAALLVRTIVELGGRDGLGGFAHGLTR